MQCFEIDHLMDKGFMKSHNVTPDILDGVNIKEDFMLKLESGITVHVPLEEIEEIARPACLACKLFANDYADISVGGLGSPDGYTTVMIRTINGKKMFADAVYDGAIEYRTRKSMSDYAVEMSSIVSRVVEFADRKKRRGEETLKKIKEGRIGN
jgi:coenzyme F420 hydrogenase subunit beta